MVQSIDIFILNSCIGPLHTKCSTTVNKKTNPRVGCVPLALAARQQHNPNDHTSANNSPTYRDTRGPINRWTMQRTAVWPSLSVGTSRPSRGIDSIPTSSPVQTRYGQRRAHRMANMIELIADLNFRLALNMRIRCKLSPNWLSASASSPIVTHECCNACAAVMRSKGSTVSILHNNNYSSIPSLVSNVHAWVLLLYVTVHLS